VILSGRLSWRISALLCLVLLVAACGSQPSATAGSDEPSATEPADTRRPTTMPAPTEPGEPGTVAPVTRPTPVWPHSPEPVPTAGVGPVTGEVPERLLAAILADAAARSGSDAAAFTVIRAEAVTWGDGSLGCPQPDVMYTQALVDGYWVVLQQGDQTLDYRASEGGYFVLCESQQLFLPPLPGPDVSGTPQQ
jgi:hypothetical protein